MFYIAERSAVSEMDQRASREWRTWIALVSSSLLFKDGGPHVSEALVESELFPHLESFFTAQGSALYETMDSTMGVAIFVSFVIKSVRHVTSSFTRKNCAKSIRTFVLHVLALPGQSPS